ncbi:glycosyltransferase [Aquimarina muelleri]|uniref:Uncharacterized protein n=1 Tax=Aquimarina muelleri TaxID=279356 RepID=A0A918N367_9FLAO|nr:glycosyltransferase [Aquimarina muelleri]MCX2764191.1 glycosyltransferase [Aquimarina muelleri]GGX19487.1 hypothetical protein GCM10007384_20980 [Aquimarina muelleri]
MKIAYVCVLDLDKYEGVSKKIFSQVNQWIEYGHNVRLFCKINSINKIEKSSLSKLKNQNVSFFFNDRSNTKNIISNWLGNESIYDEIYKSLIDFNPDIVYYRSSFTLPFFLKINKNFKSVVEINTIEKKEYKILAKDSLSYFLKYLYFLLTIKMKFNNVNGFVAVTTEIANELERDFLNIKTFVVPNSIDLENKERYHNVDTDGHPNAVFLGTPNLPWHGLDIILELAKKIPSIKFHIIGFKSIEIEKEIDNVITYGYLNKKEYSKVLEKCDFAIGSLAMYRNHMNEACPLKIREYLAFGLPIIISFKETAFELSNYPDWVLRLPNNRKEIIDSHEKIKAFAHKFKGKKIPIDEVYTYISTEIVENKRLNFFNNIINE